MHLQKVPKTTPCSTSVWDVMLYIASQAITGASITSMMGEVIIFIYPFIKYLLTMQ